MKKALVIFGVLIITLLCSISVFAMDTDDSGMWEYQTYGSGVELTSYKGTQTDVYVPSKITKGSTEYSVLKLSDELFKGNTSLNSATLGEGITEIGASAFEGATNLVCIVTPESLTTIGNNAFSGCTNFNSVILYDDTKMISSTSFEGCPSLTIYGSAGSYAYEYANLYQIPFVIISEYATPEMVVIDGITYYISNGESILVSCSDSVTGSVKIPAHVNGKPVKSINEAAFKNCTAIVSVHMEDTVVNIGVEAFYGCTSLESIRLSERLSKIGENAFYECKALKSISIPYYVTEIPQKVFYKCTALNEVIFNENISIIGDYAFYRCSSIKTLNFPDALYSIGQYAFQYCSSLSEIKFNYALNKIGSYSFLDCDSLHFVVLPPNVKEFSTTCFENKCYYFVYKNSYPYTEIKRYAYVENLKYKAYDTSVMPLVYEQDKVIYEIVNNEAIACYYTYTAYTTAKKYVKIPETVRDYPVTDIGQTFRETDIGSITLPDTITFINSSAFSGCDKLSEVILPKNLVTIKSNAFYGCASLNTITIPETVTTISSFAFLDCYNLKTITIPDSVSVINEYAFKGCTSLEEVALSTNITYIPEGLFSGCSSLKTVNIPQKVTTLKSTAFKDCISLTSITIPNSVSEMDAMTFEGCINLTDINIGEDNTYLTYENGAFFNFNKTKLIRVMFLSDDDTYNIPQTVTEIGDNSFCNRTDLTNIVIPDSVVNIGRYAFSGCSSLKNIYFPDSVKTISHYAFSNCTSLTDIEIPSAVTTISSYTFYRCSSLKKVTLPKTLSKIEVNSFIGCPQLSVLTIPQKVGSIDSGSFDKGIILCVYEDSYAHKFADYRGYAVFLITDSNPYPEIYQIDGVVYHVENESVKILSWSTTDIVIPEDINGHKFTDLGTTFKNSNITTISLPSSVTVIPADAFSGCKSLKKVRMTDEVTAICDNAFWCCSSLNDIVLSSKITHLGEKALYSCSALTDITIPDGVTSIGAHAFGYCTQLKSITIPSSVSTIGTAAFIHCNRMTDVTVGDGNQTFSTDSFYLCEAIVNLTIGSGRKSFGDNSFRDCDNLKNVYIISLKDWCQSVFNNQYATPLYYADNLYLNGTVVTDLVFPEEITYINNHVFYTYEKLTSVTFSEKLTSIGNYSFYGTQIKELVLPDNVTFLGTGVFGNTPISSIVFSAGLHKIPADTFRYCRSLRSVTIPEHITIIGSGAFYNCMVLNELVLPDALTSIGASAFYACGNLKSVNLPESLTFIGSQAFSKTAISGIAIPSGINQLSSYVFEGCSSLKSITIPANIKKIDTGAFKACINLSNVTLPEGVTSIGDESFYGCTALKDVTVPKTVNYFTGKSFPGTTMLYVHQDSYAHTQAKNMDLLYFVISQTMNPEINFKAIISGTVAYSDRTPVSSVYINLLDDYGNIRGNVKTDSNGRYAFNQVEVGRYTILVTDADGNTASEVVSVKRMNVFDVYLAGETDLVLKKGYNVSGTVLPIAAKVTISDTKGNIIKSVDITDGTFTFGDIPRGSYIVKAENETGRATTEIYVSNADVTGISLEIQAQSATITGDTKIENRDGTYSAKIWVSVDLIDEAGNVVAHTKTDADGKYTFNNIPAGSYNIVATATEMRPDIIGGFDKNHELKGYGHIDVTEFITYTVDTIILREDKVNLTSVSGKVTANGTTQDCQVILTNENGDQIALFVTDKNGKYNFVNIPDGMYCITAITKNDGMGFAVITIKNSVVHGDTDIKVAKADKISKREPTLLSIPDCNTKEEALLYKEAVLAEKAFYDSLSDKERKQLSEEWLEKLFKLIALISDSSIQASEGVTVENVESVISSEEIDETIEFALSVTEVTAADAGEDGISTEEEYETEKIKEKGKNKEIAKYYDITFSKDGQNISNIQKQTETNGKLRITMDIPEEYRGHKHYSFIHMHKGEAVTLVDLDDDPNTVTFEIDKFSTFALAYSDVELIGEVEETIYPVSITYNAETGKISVSSTETGKLYIATYDGERLSSVAIYDVTANAAAIDYAFASNQVAFVWDENLRPLCEKFTISN